MECSPQSAGQKPQKLSPNHHQRLNENSVITIIARPALSLNMASNAARTKVGKPPSVPSTLVGMTAVSYFKKPPSTK
jgi:hypothetical protein